MRRDERLRYVISDILFREWDPVGVNDIERVSDEYDSYPPGLTRVACDGGPTGRNMSDDYLKIIPTSAECVPPKRTHRSALVLLRTFFPEGEDFQVEIYDEIEFIDQGENIEAVICPACKQRLEMEHFTEGDPIVAWWYELSEAMDGTAVTAITTRMPCCGRVVRMMDLEFDWPAGFARFELNVMNPNVAENLTESQLRELEQILGCRLRQVRAHY
ncbi:MAG: hypothetical protein KDB14_30310 [Planctomycetales bacterium]|nr:hypothetical protein [Planctomycetales bacterium]